ncbi:lysophospholipid acyltransferase family protein [Aestuariibius sp. HNIBRBA575]|uniref:lysophospholipid acyltransferase family protein n=1 Tax=Aestuariibius sp. HNIBRBA575 TaxID=3233343 RepID=UPI0034A4EA55
MTRMTKISKADRQVARDISYASSASSRGGRALIRTIENATGRLQLIKRVQGYSDDVAQGANFWDVVCDRYGLSLNVVGGSLNNIPATGPVILVANHPYGILDGLMMGAILSKRRPSAFKILAHRIFQRSAELEQVILPVSFDETKEAAKLNLRTRSDALAHLKDGGAIGIFPGGTVSTSEKPFSTPLDPSWRNFTAKMIARSDAIVVPVFFEGANSRLFQLASHMHANLRLSMLIREFKRRVDEPVNVVIGEPIDRQKLDAVKTDAKACMDFLRKATYDLSPTPLAADRLGHEFEEKYKVRHGSRNIR